MATHNQLLNRRIKMEGQMRQPQCILEVYGENGSFLGFVQGWNRSNRMWKAADAPLVETTAYDEARADAENMAKGMGHHSFTTKAYHGK
jgi:hypothetical protein